MIKGSDDKDTPPEYCIVDPNPITSGYELVSKEVHSKEKNEKDDLRKPVLHYIKKGDTLTSLALRYQIDKGYIRSLNRMTTDEVSSYQTLWIPTNLTNLAEEPDPEFLEAKRQERLIARFRCITKCSDVSEARIYLEDKNFDIDEAVSSYQEDVEWERSNPMPSCSTSHSSKPSKSFLGFKTWKI